MYFELRSHSSSMRERVILLSYSVKAITFEEGPSFSDVLGEARGKSMAFSLSRVGPIQLYILSASNLNLYTISQEYCFLH